MKKLPWRFLALSLLCGGEACRSPSAGPYRPPSEEARDTRRAESLTQEALASLDSDPQDAERLLREALTADLFFGPAHNDLGVLFLNQSKLYEAANEFEWAKKLMPGHPEPRLNLGLTLERAGQIDEAIESYDSALEAYPGHLRTTQALSRLLLRAGRDDERLPSMLKELALRGETEVWREWAREQATRLRRFPNEE